MLFLALILGCNDGEGPSGGTPVAVEEPIYSGEWDVLTKDDLDVPLPTEDGVVMYLGAPDLGFDLGVEDPVTAAGACLAQLASCYAPGERNGLGCLQNVPQCETSTPWAEASMCCPSACADAYLEQRQTLATPDALIEAVLGEDSCIDGFNAFVEADQ